MSSHAGWPTRSLSSGAGGLVRRHQIRVRRRQPAAPPCSSSPQVVFKAVTTGGQEIIVDCPSKLPEANKLDSISEPYVR